MASIFNSWKSPVLAPGRSNIQQKLQLDEEKNIIKLEKLHKQAQHQQKIDQITEAYLKAEENYQKQLQDLYLLSEQLLALDQHSQRLRKQIEQQQNIQNSELQKKLAVIIDKMNTLTTKYNFVKTESEKCKKNLEEKRQKYQNLLDTEEQVVNPEKVKAFIDYYRKTQEKNWFVRKYRYRKLSSKYIEALANLKSENVANAKIRAMDWDSFVTGFFETTMAQLVRYPFRLLPAIDTANNIIYDNLIDIFRWECHMDLGAVLGKMDLGNLLNAHHTQNYSQIFNQIKASTLLETYQNIALANIYHTWQDLKSKLLLEKNLELDALILQIDAYLQTIQKFLSDQEYLHKIRKSLRNNEDLDFLMLSTAELSKATADVLTAVASVSSPLSGLAFRMLTQLTCLSYGFVEGPAYVLHNTAKRHTNSQHASKLIPNLNDAEIIKNFRKDLTPKIENKKQNFLHFLNSDLQQAKKDKQRYELKLEILKRTEQAKNYHQIQQADQWNIAFSKTHRYCELVFADLQDFFDSIKTKNLYADLNPKPNEKIQKLQKIYDVWNRIWTQYNLYLNSETGKNLSLIEILELEQKTLYEFLTKHGQELGIEDQVRVKKFEKFYDQKIKNQNSQKHQSIDHVKPISKIQNQIKNDIQKYQKKQEKKSKKLEKIKTEISFIEKNNFNALKTNSFTVKYFSTYQKLKQKIRNTSKITPAAFGPGQFLVAAVPLMNFSGNKTGSRIEDALISPEAELLTLSQIGAINAGAEAAAAPVVISSLTPLLNPKTSIKYQKITPGLATKTLGHENYTNNLLEKTTEKTTHLMQWIKNACVGVGQGALNAAKNTYKKTNNNVKNPNQNFSAVQKINDQYRVTQLKKQTKNLNLISENNKQLIENLSTELSKPEIYILHRKEIQFLLNKFQEKNQYKLKNKTKIFDSVLEFNLKLDEFTNNSTNSKNQLKDQIQKLNENEKLILVIQIGSDRKTVKDTCPHYVNIVIENKEKENKRYQKTFTIQDPYSVTGSTTERLKEVEKLAKKLTENYKLTENIDITWAKHEHRINSGYDTDKKLRYAATGILALQLAEITTGLSEKIPINSKKGLHSEIFALQKDFALKLNPSCQKLPKPPQNTQELYSCAMQTLRHTNNKKHEQHTCQLTTRF